MARSIRKYGSAGVARSIRKYGSAGVARSIRKYGSAGVARSAFGLVLSIRSIRHAAVARRWAPSLSDSYVDKRAGVPAAGIV